MPVSYRAGTVAVTLNSTTVTGTGTAWQTNRIVPGYQFAGPDGKDYEVAAVAGETSLTLTSNYKGATAAGQDYSIWQTFSAVQSDTLDRVNALIAMLETAVMADQAKLGAPSVADAVLATKGGRVSFENTAGVLLDILKGALSQEGWLRFFSSSGVVEARMGLGANSSDMAIETTDDNGASWHPSLLLDDATGRVTLGESLRFIGQSTPVGLANGDIWLDSTSARFKVRQSGQTVDLVPGPFVGTTANGLVPAVTAQQVTDRLFLMGNGWQDPWDPAPVVDSMKWRDMRADGLRRTLVTHVDFDRPMASDFDVTSSGTGAGATIVTGAFANIYGRSGLNTGTTATGSCFALRSEPAALVLGTGEKQIRGRHNLSALSNSGDRYQAVVGFLDTAALLQTDGVYFLYDEGGAHAGSTASANWQCVAASNGVRSFVTTTVAVVTGTINTCIKISEDGSTATFFIAGVQVASLNTNVPSGSARALTWGAGIVKSVGATSRALQLDSLTGVFHFTSNRS